MPTQQTTTKAQQDEKQDTSSGSPKPGESSPDGEKTVRTYTETEYGKMRREMQLQINEAQKEVRELKAAHLTLQEDLEAAQRRSATLEEEVGEAYDDEKLKAVVLKFRKEKLDFENIKSTFSRDKEEFDRIARDANQKDMETLADKLATQFGVDVGALMKLDTPEKMKAYALDNFDASKIKSDASQEAEETERLEKPVLPGVGAGGPKTIFTSKDIDSMDVKTFAEHRENVLKALAGGKIKD